MVTLVVFVLVLYYTILQLLVVHNRASTLINFSEQRSNLFNDPTIYDITQSGFFMSVGAISFRDRVNYLADPSYFSTSYTMNYNERSSPGGIFTKRQSIDLGAKP